MNSLPRFVGFSVLLLLAFLAVALSAPTWLERQAQQARTEAITARKTRLETAVRALPRAPESWNEAFQSELGALVGGTVNLVDHPGNPAVALEPETNVISFEAPVETAGSHFKVRVTFSVPSSLRLLAVYQKATVGLLLFGAVLLWLVAFFAVLRRRASLAEAGTRSPWQRSRLEMGSLEQLAKTSLAHKDALDEERDNRRRAEEDAQLKGGLLNRSIEARIGLGRDLHDGIIQSLYAVGLMVESARGLLKTKPAEADKRLEQCRENLNRTIREVRDYIGGLAPESLRRATFSEALEGLFRELETGGQMNFDLKVDEEAMAMLTADQTTEALQIAREAMSNAIRHGGASLLTVRLHKSDREVCLLVQDNGSGFDVSRRRAGGHGLENMHARASQLGAATRITSRAGEGTRVVVTFKMAPATVA